jgi:hypothetical protein
MNIDWKLNDELRVWGSPNDICWGLFSAFCHRNWFGLYNHVYKWFLYSWTNSSINFIYQSPSSDSGVVFYVHCWTVSSASTCSYSQHCHNYEICFFSKCMHFTEHITLQRGWHGNHGVIHTHQVTQDPYFVWQLLPVTCVCCSAACVGDQLYSYVNMINTLTASGSWQLWDKVKVITLYKVDTDAVMPCR